jgi:DNA repair exonuclease SbcCD nuclease subunit
MKIACINDLHLNIVSYNKIFDKEYTNLPFRQGDFIRAFKNMVDQCVDEIKPDLVILGGDVYDYYEPSNEIRGLFASQLERFVDANIPVVIIVGNHDVCKKHHGLKGIQELNLKNIKVLEEPKMVKFKDHQLLLFPYSISVERQMVKIRDQYNQFLKDCKDDREDIPAVFVGHFGIKGATISEYNLKKKDVRIKGNYVNDNGDDISVGDIDKLGDLNVDHVMMGDYHKHQTLPTKDCYALYSGSIEKTDFSEKDQKKGFLVYDTDNEEIDGYGKCRFVEYKNCRPMLELNGTLFDMKKQFAKTNYDNYQKAIVKFKFEGDRNESTAFSLGLREFKKEIVEAIDPIHLVHESKVRNTEQEEKVKELKEEAKEEDIQVGEDDVIVLLREMIRERAENEDEAKELITMMEGYYTRNRGK